MKILITGITGLIGNYLMRVLLEKGNFQIRGHYFSNRSVEAYTTKGIEMWQADICDAKAVQDITAGCEVVVHTAARVLDFGTREEFYSTHYDATHTLLKDAQKHQVKHFIYISSVGVASGIDRSEIIPDETTLLVRTGVLYDDAKIDTEKLVIDFCKQHKIYYTIIRPTAVIGEGAVWVTEPLRRLDTPVGLKLIDGGKHPACLLDAENLANGIYLCITKEIARNQIYFFMDDWNVDWKTYLNDLAAWKNKKVTASLPFWLVYRVAAVAEIIFPLLGKRPPFAKKSTKATGRDRTVSTKKARTELGWTSAVTYTQSMQRIAAWVRQNGI